MAPVIVVSRVASIGNDTVKVYGTIDGVPYVVTGWVSAMAGMTNAQKLAYCKQQLAAAAAPNETDLGISG
jgi:hypothetical protein